MGFKPFNNRKLTFYVDRELKDFQSKKLNGAVDLIHRISIVTTGQI